MLLLVGFICVVAFVLFFDDGLDYVLDTFEEIGANLKFAAKFVVSRARRYGRFVRNLAIVLAITYAVGLVGLTIALIVQWTPGVIGISILLTLVAAIFFAALNWVMIVTKRSGASTLATLTLLPLPVILWAAGAPFHFYEWFLTAYGGLILVGFAFMILGKLINSKIFLAPYVITGIVLISGIGFALIYAFPQEARAMVIDWKIANRDSGRESLAKEITLRKEDTFKADASWWHFTTDSAGRTKQSRYVDVNNKQCSSIKDTPFKTVLAPANSVENGGTYIQAYFADSKTKEYAFLDLDDRIDLRTEDPKDQTINMGTVENPCIVKIAGKKLEDLLPWVDASKTTSTAKVFDEAKAEDKKDVPGNVVSTTSGIVVEARKSAKHTGVQAKAGDVIVPSVSGSVVWDPKLQSVSHTGTDYLCSTRQQSSDFPLPSIGCGALVVEVAGTKYPATGPITIKNGGEIILDVNDRYQARPDNSGAFTVNLEVRR